MRKQGCNEAIITKRWPPTEHIGAMGQMGIEQVQKLLIGRLDLWDGVGRDAKTSHGLAHAAGRKAKHPGRIFVRGPRR